MKELENKWERIVALMSDKFAEGDTIDLQGILFIIGIQELGQGYREFSKEEKLDLLHIAICSLLSTKEYYTIEGKDDEGWPHYEKSDQYTDLSPKEQKTLLKQCIVEYFEKENVAF